MYLCPNCAVFTIVLQERLEPGLWWCLCERCGALWLQERRTPYEHLRQSPMTVANGLWLDEDGILGKELLRQVMERTRRRIRETGAPEWGYTTGREMLQTQVKAAIKGDRCDEYRQEIHAKIIEAKDQPVDVTDRGSVRRGGNAGGSGATPAAVPEGGTDGG
jgi:hypothetical protein